ncbi:hypothetical protein [Pseudomonas poae]|uniref:Uncharacterized protein n=1 Tax=Pseudomonas poae TaxID=200451 RepID=A0ABY0RBI7_9PSED|nr:hypothetical protein [Pseudomonas poae]KRP44082.1 hypothetical protein TU75_22655 [Pseudomonas poae]SDN51095.1 hypothetical protein SAMN04490208_0542 [Pseudomonas poae]
MADYSELKRMAEHHLSLGHAYTVAKPSVLLALIAENERVLAAISTPESVFINMKAGRIAKISLRSAIDLHGEVINGDDAQQIEIARLRAEVAGLRTGYEAYERVNAELKAENEALRKHAERYRWLRDSECAGRILRDMGAKVCRHADQRIDAAMGKGEQS